MPWTPLAARLQSLPLILSGPIPRRVEPRAVTVWVALRSPRIVTLRVYERDTDGALRERCVGKRRAVRLGDALHSAQAPSPLPPPTEKRTPKQPPSKRASS